MGYTHILNYEIQTPIKDYYTFGGWSENAPELVIGYTSLAGFDSPVDLAVHCLTNEGFRWGLGLAHDAKEPIYRKNSSEQLETDHVIFMGSITDLDPTIIAKNSDSGVDEDFVKDFYHKKGSVIIGVRIGRINTGGMDPLDALQRIEVHEGTVIPTEICYAIANAWELSMRNEKIADMDVFRTYLSFAINAGVNGINKFVFPAKVKEFAEIPLSNTKIKKITSVMIDKFFDIQDDTSLQNKMERVFEENEVIRTTDYARIFMNLSNILAKRGKNWYSNANVIRFAQDNYANEIAPIINLAAVDFIIANKPVENFGYGNVLIGELSIDHIDPFRVMYEPEYLDEIGSPEDVLDAMIKVQSSQASRLSFWLQLMELRTGGIPGDVAKSLFGYKLVTNAIANSDSDMDFSEDTIALLNEISEAFLEDAEKNASFVPFGMIRVNVPFALRDVLTHTKYRKSELFDSIQIYRNLNKAMEELGETVYCPYRLYIYALPDCLWVRPQHIDGKYGFIFEWRADKPMRKMLFSKGNYAFYNAMLSGIWHDLRVKGEKAFQKRNKKREISPFEDSDFDAQFDGADTKEPTKKDGYRNIPRHSYSGEVIDMEGDFEWGDESDHEIIHNRMHGVSGHARLLPSTWNASEKAIKGAKQYGIILPSSGRVTFVKPYVRGKHSDDDVMTGDVVVKAQALATLASLDLINPTLKKDDKQIEEY